MEWGEGATGGDLQKGRVSGQEPLSGPVYKQIKRKHL